MTRRNFVRNTSVSTAGLLTTNLWPQTSATTARANNRIGVGVIGLGIMGGGQWGHWQHLLGRQDEFGIRVIGGCDVFEPLRTRATNYARNKFGRPVEMFNDFRDLLLRKDVDAVFIATPDHWHALMTVAACKAGKDVYVQKPISIDTHESKIMVEVVRQYHRVCQVGTQQASSNVVKTAIAIVQSGVLGKIIEVKCFMRFPYQQGLLDGPYNAEDSIPPPDLDWDMWLGPMPEPPYGPANNYNPDLFGLDTTDPANTKGQYGDPVDVNGQRFCLRGSWRLFRPAGGLITDWGIHFWDNILRIMHVRGPIAISIEGATFLNQDKRQLPDNFTVVYKFDNFLGKFEAINGNLFTAETPPQRINRSYGTFFYGTEGTLFLDRERCLVIPDRGKNLEMPLDQSGLRIPLETKDDGKMDERHTRNFFDCIRQRTNPAATIENGKQATDMCIAAVAAYWIGQRLDWDPESGTTSEEAQSLLNLKYREPWKLEL